MSGGLRDLTDAAPVRRMAVVRGRLASPRLPAAVPDDAATWARAAAVAAVKRAADLLPLQHAVAATHVDVLLAPAAGTGGAIDCTVTVQGFARAPLDAQAQLGCAAALLTLRDALGLADARIEAVATVQNVPS